MALEKIPDLEMTQRFIVTYLQWTTGTEILEILNHFYQDLSVGTTNHEIYVKSR